MGWKICGLGNPTQEMLEMFGVLSCYVSAFKLKLNTKYYVDSDSMR
jgi:hypothetical protein